MKKILCMIDAQNIFYTPREIYKSKIDYRKLLNKIQKDVCPAEIDVYLYLVADAVVNQTPFLQLLQNLGYQTRIKLMYFFKNTPLNTNWDDEMIQDAERMMPDYDGIIMVSGDHGFIPLLDQWEMAEKETYVYCFKEDVSIDFIRSQHPTNFFGKEVIFKPSMESHF